MKTRAGIALVLAAIAAAGAAAADQARPRDRVLGGAELVDGDEAPGLVAFTFDDGPRPGTTEAVLEALVAYDVPAAFFVVGSRLTGKRAQPARDLLARIVELGFDVGNHSHTHPDLADLDRKAVAAELDRASDAIRAVTGAPVGLFRPPFGSHGKHARAHAAAAGLTTVMWSVDSLDWRGPDGDVMVDAVVGEIVAENGGVVLFHDTKKLTARTIARVLDELEARNCARLAAGEPAIVPVSLHYFLRDRGKARPVPDEVEARTRRYRDRLPGRCAARKP